MEYRVDPNLPGAPSGPRPPVVAPYPQPDPNRSPGPSSRHEPRRIRATTAAALCLATALAGGFIATGVGASAAPSEQAAAVATTPSAAEPAVVNALAGNQTIVNVAQSVGPAVVAIQVTGTISTVNSFGPGFQSQPYQFNAAGSGVIVDPSGLILTNRHVVGDANTVTVLLADGRQLDGTVDGLDTLTDLAFVKVDASDLPAATIGTSSDIQVGELAIAIGNPEGDLPGSVTSGIVSALDRDLVVGDQTGMQSPEMLRHLIQHDAAINPGNSGGPLVDGSGAVIGINTAIAGNTEGIGFAIPIDLAGPIIKQVEAGQPIARPYIGVYYTDINAQLAEDQGLSVNAGALIQGDAQTGQPGVIAGGPAEQAGLQEGDIVTAVDGQTIDAAHQLDLLLLQHEPGDTITLTVLRGDKTLQPELTLGTREADLSQ